MNEGSWTYILCKPMPSLKYFVDHSDALSYYLEYYAGTKAAPKDCLMTHIDKEGMEIEILSQKDKTIVRVPLDPPLK